MKSLRSSEKGQYSSLSGLISQYSSSWHMLRQCALCITAICRNVFYCPKCVLLFVFYITENVDYKTQSPWWDNEYVQIRT